MFIRQFKKSVLLDNLKRKVEYALISMFQYFIISRRWLSQKIKIVFTKGTKAALHFQVQETWIGDTEAV